MNTQFISTSTSTASIKAGKDTSMKRWLLALIFFSSAMCSAATILNPMDFNGSDTQKKQVIESITATEKKDYGEKIDMGQENTQCVMKKQNLDSFKEATKFTYSVTPQPLLNPA